MEEIHMYIAGTVQGVGFRAAVKRHAELHDIKGYVKNLPDGRVEICAQGNRDQIDDFIRTVRSRPGLGSISDLQMQLKPIQELFSSFEVR